jgi:hypothetical protein
LKRLQKSGTLLTHENTVRVKLMFPWEC